MNISFLEVKRDFVVGAHALSAKDVTNQMDCDTVDRKLVGEV